MLVGFFSLKSHSQNMAREELRLFSADLPGLNSTEDKLIHYNFLPTLNQLTNAEKFEKASVNAIGFNLNMGVFLILSRKYVALGICLGSWF